MAWEDILKDFKGSKIDFKTMQKNNESYAEFLEYRIDRVKSNMDNYDENKEEYDLEPNTKEFRKSLEREYNFLKNFIEF